MVDDIIITDELGCVQFRKPCDIAFRIMANKWRMSYADIVYVGDNVNKDFKAPQQLGMESFTRFASNKKYDLFISHSFNDRELVAGLYHLFNKAGYDVYIDWIDDKQLNRHYVTSETANLIKNRIRASLGTAYISTENSTSSKWCPWELGLADGMKGKVCILPVMNHSFRGQEYLGLYPYLEYEKSRGKINMTFGFMIKYILINILFYAAGYKVTNY